MEFMAVVVEFGRLSWSSGGCREVRGGCYGVQGSCRGVRAVAVKFVAVVVRFRGAFYVILRGFYAIPSDILYCILHNPSIPQRSDVR